MYIYIEMYILFVCFCCYLFDLCCFPPPTGEQTLKNIRSTPYWRAKIKCTEQAKQVSATALSSCSLFSPKKPGSYNKDKAQPKRKRHTSTDNSSTENYQNRDKHLELELALKHLTPILC